MAEPALAAYMPQALGIGIKSARLELRAHHKPCLCGKIYTFQFNVPTKAGDMAVSADDRTLALRIRHGDAPAVEAFVEKFRGRIEWLAGRYGVRPIEDCQDVAQDVLAAAVDQIQRNLYRAECTLGTWIERIVHGKVIDFNRSPGRRPVHGAHLNDQNSGGLPGALITQPKQETVAAVHEALLALPRNHRIILILNKVGGLTIAEISARLRWPKGTVGRVLAEAEQMFRKKMGGREEFHSRLRLSIGSGEH